MKRILSAVLVAGMFSVGSFGCAEKPPAKNEIKITTPGGTTVTIEKPIEKPVEDAGRNPPPVKP
ncbi:MAG: hypothetical protein ABR915_17290 [Thermoguttaceae bacterium]